MSDPVHHPAHYNSSPAQCKHGHPVECIDVVQWMTFSQGNAVKYLWRLFDKGDPVENLRKAIEYCEFEIARLSQSGPALGEHARAEVVQDAALVITRTAQPRSFLDWFRISLIVRFLNEYARELRS